MENLKHISGPVLWNIGMCIMMALWGFYAAGLFTKKQPGFKQVKIATYSLLTFGAVFMITLIIFR